MGCGEDGTLGIHVPALNRVGEGTLTISVPVVTPEDTQHAQARLAAQRAAAARAGFGLGHFVAHLHASIAAVKAQGADPRRPLATTAGYLVLVDLPAMRQALLDEKANEISIAWRGILAILVGLAQPFRPRARRLPYPRRR